MTQANTLKLEQYVLAQFGDTLSARPGASSARFYQAASALPVVDLFCTICVVVWAREWRSAAKKRRFRNRFEQPFGPVSGRSAYDFNDLKRCARSHDAKCRGTKLGPNLDQIRTKLGPNWDPNLDPNWAARPSVLAENP